jgi:cyclic pyranopterin phosphate synthase
MFDITSKNETYREAKARGQIILCKKTVKYIREGKITKGDPLYTAQIAGILAAKKTSSLIPLCHPIPLTKVEVELKVINENTVEAESLVKTRARTGVEMEALVATTTALLTVWDMTKQYEKDAKGQYPFTSIKNIQVVRKIKEQVS